MFSEELAKTISDITLNWKRFYVAFRNHFVGSDKWLTPKWVSPIGLPVDLCAPNGYVDHYRAALGNRATKALDEHSRCWNERLINLMTRGDCGLTALAIGIALNTKGVDVRYAINSEESHGFLVVDGHIVDVTGFHSAEVVSDAREYAGLNVLTMCEFSEFWIPYDFHGWLMLRHWAEHYSWDFEGKTLVDEQNPNGCISPPQIHLGGPTLREIFELNEAGICARQALPTV